VPGIHPRVIKPEQDIESHVCARALAAEGIEDRPLLRRLPNRVRPSAACRCSMPSPALYRPVSSGPLTCSSTTSIGSRPLDTRPLISEILAGMTLSAAGEKPPPGAGAAQCGDGDFGVVGAKGVAEGQREKHAEWRTALRLSVEQASEEHRLRCRLSPPDCDIGTRSPKYRQN